MQQKRYIYIIEHLEPELFKWCLIEYKNISEIVGKSNLWFTNIREKDKSKLSKHGKVFEKSVKELGLDQKSVCILDPEAEKELSTEESNKFDYYIFGGILGDNPPRKRTSPELSVFFPKTEKRNIGKSQFSTDNAVYVVKQIAENKKGLSDLKFQQGIEIKTGKHDSIQLPYLYPLINGKPQISKELIKFLKNKQNF